MIERLDTKTLLAESVLDLAKKKPIGKITISNITDNCMMCRETFYKHFTDKYDIINWVLGEKIYNLMRESTKNIKSYDSAMIRCTKYFESMKEIHFFISNALNDDFSAIFDQNLQKYNDESILDHLIQSLDTEQISKEILFYARFYSYGVANITKDWIYNGMKESEGFMADMKLKSMPSELKEVYW